MGFLKSSLNSRNFQLKFIYSEKATKFCEISTVDLSYVVTVKSTVAFSEYMNFIHIKFLIENNMIKLTCKTPWNCWGIGFKMKSELSIQLHQ